MTRAMQVIVHTVDHQVAEFEVANGPAEDQVLAGLHPDKAFGHHHLVIQGEKVISLIVSSKITFVELRDMDRKEWPFYDVIFEANLLDGGSEAGGELDRCFRAVIHLSDGKHLALQIVPLETGGVVPCPEFVMEQLLARPSLHVKCPDGRVLLVNGAHVLRGDFQRCEHASHAAVHLEMPTQSERLETQARTRS